MAKQFRLKRLVLNQREFSKTTDQLIDLSETSCKEIMKIFELHETNSTNIKHRLEVCSGNIFKLLSKCKQDKVSVGLVFSPEFKSEKVLMKFSGSGQTKQSILTNLKYGIGDDFIENRIKHLIITEKNGSWKYPDLKTMSDFKYSNEIYSQLYLWLGLNFCVPDLWTSDETIREVFAKFDRQKLSLQCNVQLEDPYVVKYIILQALKKFISEYQKKSNIEIENLLNIYETKPSVNKLL